MNSRRPYLIRALYEWIVDNDCAPYILVDASLDGVDVPREHVNQQGQIILNLAPEAIIELHISNELVSFNARFAGLPRDVFVPIGAVIGIYARENGQGVMFGPDDSPEPPSEPTKNEKAQAKTSRPGLRVVK